MLIKSIPTWVSNRYQCGGSDTLVSVPSQAAVVANWHPVSSKNRHLCANTAPFHILHRSSSSPALLCCVPQTTDAINRSRQREGREKAEHNLKLL